MPADSLSGAKGRERVINLWDTSPVIQKKRACRAGAGPTTLDRFSAVTPSFPPGRPTHTEQPREQLGAVRADEMEPGAITYGEARKVHLQ